MGSLSFVGLGLWDARDMSVKGLEWARAADSVFLETYTAFLGDASAADLEAHLGRPITRASREDVEGGEGILAAAREGDVVLLVTGDPMAATTHVDLRLRATREGIPVRIAHAGSIVTAAAGLLGLSGYKFGRTTTLVFPEGNYFPTSPYDVVKENLARGLHSLVLLDLRATGWGEGLFMTATQGARLLLEMEERRGEGALSRDTVACAIARAGSAEPVLVRGGLGGLAGGEYGEPLHALVVLGALNEVEAEALEVFATAVGALGT